jgi:hypothetical protein
MSLNELDAMRAALTALQDLPPEAQARALRWLSEALNIEVEAAALSDDVGDDEDDGGDVNAQKRGGGRKPSAKQFLLDKDPPNKGEQLAALGYYKTHYEDTETFETKELVELNVDAGGPRISNPARDMDNATRKAGLFVAAGGNRKKLSAMGELVVEAMPDREKVKEILKKRRPKRSKKKGTKRKSPAKKARSGK